LILVGSLQISLGICVAILLVTLLWRQYRREEAKRADQGRKIFEPVFSLFENPELKRGTTAGVWTLTGHYRDLPFQLKTIADTLATRKLPSLWLMVTLPEPQAVNSTTDMMMRAAGISSFSNFDFLPHTLSLPYGFPEQATVKSDVTTPNDVFSVLPRHLEIFHHGRGKELLISPKGLRIVVQLAEGDKARYGVFREANFADAIIDKNLAMQIMDTLISLQNDIRGHAKT
jgi:hypothetical protein